MKSGSMTDDQLEQVQKEIIRIYLFLISKTDYDPLVIEVMKLSALADMRRRYDTGEPWTPEVCYT